MTSPIQTKRYGAILHVTLNRPKANAIDLATSRIMVKLLQRFATTPMCAWQSSRALVTNSFARAGI